MNFGFLLFSYSGRINRAQFWIGNLLAGVGGLLLMVALFFFSASTFFQIQSASDVLAAMGSFALVIGLPLLLMAIMSLALQTKRFHDRGRSGLFTLLPLVPSAMMGASLASAIISGASPDQAIASVTMWFMITQAVNLFMLVDLGFMPGKSEANRYGPPPGGGLGGGAPAPSNAPIPGGAKPAPQPIPGMASTLVGAESAIDRAIAAREREATKAPRAAPSPAASAPAAPLQTATPGSFGRRVSR